MSDKLFYLLLIYNKIVMYVPRLTFYKFTFYLTISSRFKSVLNVLSI